MAAIDAGKRRRPSASFITPADPQDGRGARGHGDDGLDGAGAGARHHHHVGGDDRVLGATIASTSSIRPGTWTSPSRSSVRSACSTARSPSSTAWPASSRSPRPSGARPTATACRASAFINKMDRTGRGLLAPPSSRSASGSAQRRPFQIPIGAEERFPGRRSTSSR